MELGVVYTLHSWHIWDKIERRTTDKGGEFSHGIYQVFFLAEYFLPGE
jgi:hypothetical protein